jgi:PilZ domain
VEQPGALGDFLEMSPEGVRRSSRIPKELPILLIGSDLDGRTFSEETHTVVLSRHGAGIVSSYKLAAEQELIIRRLDTNQEAEVRVVGQIGSQADSYTYGVAFLNPTLGFWGLEFPPLTESELRARRVLLECSSCKDSGTFDHSDLESDVYAINEGIVRFCKRCGTSTVWRRSATTARDASPSLATPPNHNSTALLAATPVPPLAPLRAPDSVESIRDESPIVSPASPPNAASIPVLTPVPVPVTTPRPASIQIKVMPITSAKSSVAVVENRRKHPRTKINFTACVRQPNATEDIVACEDVSRGGLRFLSRRSYAAKCIIEVAVPYTEDAPNIFVPAQIVYVLELPERKLFRCGVAYL